MLNTWLRRHGYCFRKTGRWDNGRGLGHLRTKRRRERGRARACLLLRAPGDGNLTLVAWMQYVQIAQVRAQCCVNGAPLRMQACMHSRIVRIAGRPLLLVLLPLLLLLLLLRQDAASTPCMRNNALLRRAAALPLLC